MSRDVSRLHNHSPPFNRLHSEILCYYWWYYSGSTHYSKPEWKTLKSSAPKYKSRHRAMMTYVRLNVQWNTGAIRKLCLFSKLRRKRISYHISTIFPTFLRSHLICFVAPSVYQDEQYVCVTRVDGKMLGAVCTSTALITITLLITLQRSRVLQVCHRTLWHHCWRRLQVQPWLWPHRLHTLRRSFTLVASSSSWQAWVAIKNVRGGIWIWRKWHT